MPLIADPDAARRRFEWADHSQFMDREDRLEDEMRDDEIYEAMLALLVDYFNDGDRPADDDAKGGDLLGIANIFMQMGKRIRAAGVAEERERCAALHDSIDPACQHEPGHGMGTGAMGAIIAYRDAIRSEPAA